MENFWYIVVFFFILSIVFFSFYVYQKRQDDIGTATVHLVIGIILSIITVILFLIMVNINHLYETEPVDDSDGMIFQVPGNANNAAETERG